MPYRLEAPLPVRQGHPNRLRRLPHRLHPMRVHHQSQMPLQRRLRPMRRLLQKHHQRQIQPHHQLPLILLLRSLANRYRDQCPTRFPKVKVGTLHLPRNQPLDHLTWSRCYYHQPAQHQDPVTKCCSLQGLEAHSRVKVRCRTDSSN